MATHFLKLRLLALCAIGSAMTGCTVLREELRPTYDEEHVVPGVSRSEIERELGLPDNVFVGINGDAVASYQTSRVAAGAKSSMRDRMLCASLFTFGIGELLNPFGLTNDERKQFTVRYDHQSIARSILVYCLDSDSRFNERHPYTVTGGYGISDFTCNRACDGL